MLCCSLLPLNEATTSGYQFGRERVTERLFQELQMKGVTNSGIEDQCTDIPKWSQRSGSWIWRK